MTAIQTQFSVTEDQAKTIVATQGIISAVSFVVTSVVSVKCVRIYYFVGIGAILIIVAFVIFAIGGKSTGLAFVPSVLIGCSFGMFASNASAMLVELAGGETLGASALGLVFSLQYLIMSGIIPLGDEIAKTGEYINGILYAVLCSIALFLIILISIKWLSKQARTSGPEIVTAS